MVYIAIVIILLLLYITITIYPSMSSDRVVTRPVYVDAIAKRSSYRGSFLFVVLLHRVTTDRTECVRVSCVTEKTCP